MAKINIGGTGLMAEHNGFGALPIQRTELGEAVKILRKAFDGGMNYFDTARMYSDSEQKLGIAFDGMWDKVIIATKTMTRDVQGFWDQLHTSLATLKTDHIDIYQFHNPPFCPRPGDESGLYNAMLEAKSQGKIRFIGFTNHRLGVAAEAVKSGLYDTLQFPFSYLSTEKELELVELCREKGMGFIAMKALSGGLINNSAAACAWLMRFDNVLPIWGIQKENELDEFLSYIDKTPALTGELQAVIDADREQLQGNFCRGCGYCMPCPQGIQIDMCARSYLMLRRAPPEMMLSDSGKAAMAKIEDCTQCGKCASKCPYGLDTPALLQANYKDFKEVLAGKPVI